MSMIPRMRIAAIATLVMVTLMTVNSFAQSRLPPCPSDPNAFFNNCYGTYTSADGKNYVGEFKNDKANGQGAETFASGAKYVGEFKDDKQNGQGIYTWANGDKYVGEWKDGKRNGQGTEYLASGQVGRSGYWRDNQFVGTITSTAQSSTPPALASPSTSTQFNSGYWRLYSGISANGGPVCGINTNLGTASQPIGSLHLKWFMNDDEITFQYFSPKKYIESKYVAVNLQFDDGVNFDYIGIRHNVNQENNIIEFSIKNSESKNFFHEFTAQNIMRLNFKDNSEISISLNLTGTSAVVDKFSQCVFSVNPPDNLNPFAYARPNMTNGNMMPRPLGVSGAAVGSKVVGNIPLIKDGGVYKVPVLINGSLILNFVVDSGATDVSLPADVVLTLMRTGTLNQDDFTGTQSYTMADGSTVPSKTFRIASLKVGDVTLENVAGSMSSVEGSLLLGQSFLSRVGNVLFDYNKGLLILGNSTR